MDLRLLSPAVVVWTVTVIGLWFPSSVLFVGVGMGILCGAGVLAVVIGVTGWRQVGLLVVAGGVGATTAIGLGLTQASLTQHPLSQTTGKVSVTVGVVDDPVLIEPTAAGRVRVRVKVVGVGDRSVTSAAAVLTGRAEDWSTAVPGRYYRSVVSVRAAPQRSLMVARLSAMGETTEVGTPSRMSVWAEHVRERLRVSAARALDAEASGLFPGLVLGDLSGVDETLRDDFTAAGLSHLTAVSGANFSIVCGAAVAVLAMAGLGPRVVAVLGIVVIIGFVILVRPSPSVLRAAMMGAVGMLALMSSRRAMAMPALGAATIAGLWWWPDLAVAPGFALSVAATAGIVVWAPGLRDRLRDRRMPAGVAEVLAMAIVAQVVTAPLIALWFGQFSIVAVAANIVVAPVVGVIAVVGTAAALIGAMGPPGGLGDVVGELMIRGLAPALWWMVGCARTLGGWSWATIPVPSGPMAVLLAVGVAVLGWAGRAMWAGRGA